MDEFDNIFSDDNLLDNGGVGEIDAVIPISADIEDLDDTDTEIPKTLAILPLRNNVIFPGVIVPISITRKKSLDLIQNAYNNGEPIGTIMQIDNQIEDPSPDDLYESGTVVKILKVLELPDGSSSAIIQGRSRFSVTSYYEQTPFLIAEVTKRVDILPENKDDESLDAIVRSLKELAVNITKLSGRKNDDLKFATSNIDDKPFLINFLCNNSKIGTEDKQLLLEIDEIYPRALKLASFLTKEREILKLQKKIQDKTKSGMDQQQREYVLQQQMKAIQDELGDNPLEQEIDEFKMKASKKRWSKEVKKTFNKELDKLCRLNPSSGEFTIQMNYIELMLDLPWNKCSKDNFDLQHAQKVLDSDHFGLENVKDRIMEYLAVLKLKGDLKSPIICLYGPPGVGKTSLGKSIATALGRKYARISLGGLHDESEIRGHRKTYIGAMPGRIIQSLKKAGTSNPVFILDEIDKITKDNHGDPASALLEVLDPEQNNTFHDNYLDIDYDLSNVMFVATANSIGRIHPALRDRMEMIDISGYLHEEKVEIAKRHLLPKQLKNHGLVKSSITLSKAILDKIVDSYTRESGVRSLDKVIAKLVRRVAKKVAFEQEYDKKISLEALKEYLGKETNSHDRYEGNEYAGVVTGLAWTSVGGEILLIESSISRGSGKLSLTGNLGEVMKESGTIALKYIRANSEKLGIPYSILDKWDIHIHFPEGAVPKDGPSAGIAMTTALVSLLTQRKIKKSTAMTGEITLRGKVLPVGGIKEKILAAKRANIKDIILCKENQKDIDDINEKYIKGVRFHYAETIEDVLKIAVSSTKVKNAITFE